MAAHGTVRLETREYARGPVDQVRLTICDLHFGCDIVSERDIRLAHMLADQLGTTVDDLRRRDELLPV